MDKWLIFPAGTTAAARYAADFLSKAGIPLTDHPTPEITHLLLDVPSFGPDGLLRGGGDIQSVLECLPQDITVMGGNLDHPALAEYKTADLLADAEYVSQNAAITADCALQVAAPLLKTTFSRTPTLIIGWGRIGKCLARLLRSIGADVTVAARKETDRAMLRALGYRAADTARIGDISRYRLIFNTAPELILDEAQTALCKNSVKIDLASKKGILGDDVVWARGLPGIYAPESSGALIAETFIKLLKEGSR